MPFFPRFTGTGVIGNIPNGDMANGTLLYTAKPYTETDQASRIDRIFEGISNAGSTALEVYERLRYRAKPIEQNPSTIVSPSRPTSGTSNGNGIGSLLSGPGIPLLLIVVVIVILFSRR